jgi:putative colanic acid biosynthesis glycosyltransferase WcaI
MDYIITLIGVNFYPEDTAIGLYSTQMAEYLAQKGYKINVITGFPYYPQWAIKDEYKSKSKLYKETTHNNITVYRYRQYVPKNPTFLKRIIHLTDFTIGSLVNCFKIKKTDLVIAIVPFTTSIFLGWLLKKRLKAKLWTHIQDFEFDAALESGISKKDNNLLFKALFKLEKKLLDTTDVSSTISHLMVDKLKTKTKTKTYYFPNWINTDTKESKERTTHSFFNRDKFKILYSGNIGDKQDWEFFRVFVLALKQYKDVEVCVVGHGAKREWLLSKTQNINYLKIFEPVSLKELKSLLNSADLHILFQKDNILDTVMPSKILGMMASGKPSLITGHLNSEVSKIISKSGGGIYLPNDIKMASEAFEKLYSNEQNRLKIGGNAQKYVTKNYNKNSILSKFEKEIKILLNTNI